MQTIKTIISPTSICNKNILEVLIQRKSLNGKIIIKEVTNKLKTEIARNA
ncbi:MAG: hypothetical protein AABW67_03855 [Nanoarchaeota archaeon]